MKHLVHLAFFLVATLSNAVSFGQNQDLAYIQELARQGNPQAQSILGHRYMNGNGVPKDGMQAVKWLRLASDQGDETAQYNLGLILRKGLLNVRPNPREALELFEKSFENGLEGGIVETTIGWSFFTGDYAPDIPQDFQKSLYWNSLGAAEGHPNALGNLALHYFGGYGVPRDFAEMKKNLILSAENFSSTYRWVVEGVDDWLPYKDQAPSTFWRARELYWQAISTGQPYFLEQLRQLEPPDETYGKEPRVPDSRVFERSELVHAASGTGFAVTKEGVLITNNHVIAGCENVRVGINGMQVDAVVLSRDPSNDLALLKADFSPTAVFHLAKSNPQLLQEIYVAGYPFGENLSSSVKVTKGIISSLTGLGNNFSNMQIDAAIQPGNSGGPIFDELGNVLGVAVSTLDIQYVLENFDAIPQNTNFGIKANVVSNMLASNGIVTNSAGDEVMSTSELATLATKATYYLSCWMTEEQVRQMSSSKVLFREVRP